MSAAVPPPSPSGGVPVFLDGKPMLTATGAPASPKSRLAAGLLAWFLGVFGTTASMWAKWAPAF